MTSQEFASGFFLQAEKIFREMLRHYEAEDWHLVVRRAQETTELILKGFLRRAGLEIPKLHDVGNLLNTEKDRLPKSLSRELPRVISLSRWLHEERAASFYGDEEQELPPSALYTKIDADRARQEVEWLMTFVPQSKK